MDLQSEPMTEGVVEVLSETVSFDMFPRDAVDLLRCNSAARGLNRPELRVQDDRVDSSSQGRRVTDGNGAGEVAVISPKAASKIKRDEVAPADSSFRWTSVRKGSLGAARDDRLERLRFRAEFPVVVSDFGREVELRQPRLYHRKDFLEHLVRDGDGMADQIDLLLILDGSDVLNQRSSGNKSHAPEMTPQVLQGGNGQVLAFDSHPF